MSNTIRDILPPDHRRQRPPRAERNVPKEHDEERPQTLQPSKPRRPMRLPKRQGRMSWKLIISILVLVLAFLFVVFSLLFSGAELTLVPKTQQLVTNGTFTAHISPSAGELAYQVMTIERTDSRLVPATGKTFVEEKASGIITVYNDFNDANQRLIRNTRFESPDGLVYRINESIVVPGQDEEGSPGQIEATVYADEAGEIYNIGFSDFTIPGFKGSPQFEDFYAESKTAMTGGFIGDKLKVEDSVLDSTRAELQSTLKESLISEVTAQIPEGFLVFDGGIFVDFVSLSPSDENGEARITETATLYGFIFDEIAFAEFLASNNIAGFEGGPVALQSPENLLLSPTSDMQRPWENDEFIFQLSGSSELIWLIDEERLIEDLRGRDKNAIHTVLSGYPGVERAEAVVRPFWKSTFPAQAEQISITLNIPLGQ